MISWGPKIGKYQGLDASSRTASGFTLAWVHVYRGAGYVAECVEKVNGKPSGSWTKCGEDDNVFSEKTVNGQAVTVAQAHLYGDTASDRIVTVTIADLDLDTTGQQSFDPLEVLRRPGEHPEPLGPVPCRLPAGVHHGAVLQPRRQQRHFQRRHPGGHQLRARLVVRAHQSERRQHVPCGIGLAVHRQPEQPDAGHDVHLQGCTTRAAATP